MRTCCYSYGGIESNIDGLHAGFTRTSPEDFDFLLALGNDDDGPIFFIPNLDVNLSGYNNNNNNNI